MANLFLSKLASLERRFHLCKKRRQFHNEGITLYSANCLAGVMLHDLGQEFRTPTVNMLFNFKDYIKFLSNLEHYLTVDPVDTGRVYEGYYVSMLDDLRLYFAHVSSFEEGRACWNRRKSRVSFENVAVFMTDKQLEEPLEEADIRAFDALPFKQKVFFSAKPYPDIPSVYYMQEFAGQSEVGVLTDFRKKTFPKRRYYESFDFVAFLNGVPLSEIKARAGKGECL